MSLDATLFDPIPNTLNCLNNTLVTLRRSFRQYMNLLENWMEITVFCEQKWMKKSTDWL